MEKKTDPIILIITCLACSSFKQIPVGYCCIQKYLTTKLYYLLIFPIFFAGVYSDEKGESIHLVLTEKRKQGRVKFFFTIDMTLPTKGFRENQHVKTNSWNHDQYTFIR